MSVLHQLASNTAGIFTRKIKQKITKDNMEKETPSSSEGKQISDQESEKTEVPHKKAKTVLGKRNSRQKNEHVRLPNDRKAKQKSRGLVSLQNDQRFTTIRPRAIRMIRRSHLQVPLQKVTGIFRKSAIDCLAGVGSCVA